MNDCELIEYKDVDLNNSMLVVAFPTVGLISSIAGHFIIDTLKLEEIGRNGNMADADEAYEALEREIEHLRPVLAKIGEVRIYEGSNC